MGFLDAVKSIFSGMGDDDGGQWIYVRCNRCGEVIKTRLDLTSSLSLQDDGTHVVRKTLVGNQLCFERIEVTLTFDERRQYLGRDIAGGEFITAEAYEAAQTDAES